MTHALALVVAYCVDSIFGELPARLHPVVWIGKGIERARVWALAGSQRTQFLRGLAIALVLPSSAALLAWSIQQAAGGSTLGLLLVTALLIHPMFAARALRDAAFALRDALVERNLHDARRGLASLCSRDATDLEAPELVAATVESVAENASDSIVAPLLYFGLFGVPGIVFYRVVNTLDAMLGYHGQLEWVGKASARLDDALNVVPARLTALLLLGAGRLRSYDVARAWRVTQRDHGATESPNAGWPMATMAGLLRVTLEKRDHYVLGRPEHDGEELRPLTLERIDEAWSLVSWAALGALALALALAGALHV